MKKNVSVIAITMGDPGGIGPEVIVKALPKMKPDRSRAFVILGIRAAFELLRKKCGVTAPYQILTSFQRETLRGGKIYFLDLAPAISGAPRFRPGQVHRDNGLIALEALRKAAALARQRFVDALVTGPVSKAAIRLVDKRFIGHTEFFAEDTGTRDFAMMFLSPKLKVTLATIHVPLKNVSAQLTVPSLAKKLSLTDEILRKGLGLKRPRLGVCALNPHGEEAGGSEEKRILIPAVRYARRKGIRVSGPFSADQLFHAAYCGKYDALISMYHDQALGPFKMIAFHEGVNVTLGLPYVRTSPDHGTAFDIAYQGKADPSSMAAALRLACDLARSRYAHAD